MCVIYCSMTNQEDDITQLDMDSCARCGERQRDVPHLTFKINNSARCGHKFCSSCIDRELYSKRQFECPKCKSMVSQDKVTMMWMGGFLTTANQLCFHDRDAVSLFNTCSFLS